MKYKLCIFDLDGTLLYTLEDIKDSINYMMDKYHYPLFTLNEIQALVGNGLKKLLEDCIPEKLTEPAFNDLHAEFLNYYKANQDKTTRVYDGIDSLIDRLKSHGCHIAILSNKVRANVEILSRKYFGNKFDLSMGEDAANGFPLKPDPTGLINVAKHFNVDLSQVAYIGDGEADIHVAHEADVDFYGVTWGYRSRETHEALKANVIVDHPEELINYLID